MGDYPEGAQMEVKDTANITRKKAQLPQQEQLEHPTPVGGSWLKNRYIVNNFILLEPLGTGSYAEVSIMHTYVEAVHLLQSSPLLSSLTHGPFVCFTRTSHPPPKKKVNFKNKFFKPFKKIPTSR